MAQAISTKAYTNEDLVNELGKSLSQVKKYKKLVLSAYQRSLEMVQHPSGSLTEDGLVQVKLASKFTSNRDKDGYIKAVFQAHPELEYDLSIGHSAATATKPQMFKADALVPIAKFDPNSLGEITFDTEGNTAKLAALRSQTQDAATALGGLFTSYARTKVHQALGEIDQTVEVMKTNALTEMGIASKASS